MISQEYGEAATEVIAILENMDNKSIEKIPIKFMDFLKENRLDDYKPNFDFSKPLCELKFKPKTEALLGILYIKFWADQNEKKDFINKVVYNEKLYQNELSIKYNVNDIFKKNNKNNK